ncbi:hypothetical protein OPV22_033456 [Ensete ventricosum]|uniref:Uncharacterized protein n=1 Tax=Ensete ventricosum TaxID=4639 RepID=A0A444FZP4_ENSVE|nr:hypothetical protein OPV22_033456 [Ensete ventricosum]RRT64562.1 hypothetical protein B296_00034849 [Ensete ventricosum]RWW28081.1 hypothetical protein GW17_00007457 [Ensete ventricosum]RWW78029.1 hypothetical protein BHE74_00013770 [Ensete ventricosum]RZR83549.1 hypothetical protein BHM03_00010168 [Ensete ventricosum]
MQKVLLAYDLAPQGGKRQHVMRRVGEVEKDGLGVGSDLVHRSRESGPPRSRATFPCLVPTKPRSEPPHRGLCVPICS